jgi:hypothetical protein
MTPSSRNGSKTILHVLTALLLSAALAAAASAQTTNVACIPAPAGTMVAWHSFDDLAGPSANLATQNAAVWDSPTPPVPVAGEVGGALSFNGNSYIDAPDSIVTNFGPAGRAACSGGDYSTCQGDFSIDVWINLNPGALPLSGLHTILDKRNSSGIGYFFYLYGDPPDDNGNPWMGLNLGDATHGAHAYGSNGLPITTGAVVVKPNLPTTSSIPRYALAAAFAALLNPNLSGDALAHAIGDWQAGNVSASALARVEVVRRGVVATEYGVMVTFANGETRKLATGPSSIIAKEEFSKRFLSNPGVIFPSESGNTVVARDEALAQAIGLTIPADRYLPDILLVDLGPQHPLLVFVEVVATDGPITASRKEAFLGMTRAAGFPDNSIAFVTAYLDRGATALRKTVPELAWNSFAWFAAEPDHIIAFREGAAGKNVRLSELL